MALSLVRRRQERSKRSEGYFQPRSVVASAKKVDLNMARRRPLAEKEWQKDLWAYFDEVPEFKFLLLWRGNQMAKVRFYPATVDPNDPDGNPVPLTAEEAAIPDNVVEAAYRVMKRFRSQIGGQVEIQRRLEINMEAVGECHVVGLWPRDDKGTIIQNASRDDPGWDWLVASVDELSYKQGRGATKPGVYSVKRDPEAKPHEVVELDPEHDVMFRVWQAHGRWADLPDCTAHALTSELEWLYLLTSQGKQEARSRFSAGLLLLPNGLSVGPTPPGDVPDADEPEEGDPLADPVMDSISDTLTAVVEDPEDNASVVPLALRGAAEDLAVVRLLSLARQADATLDQKIEERVKRLARGMNAPPEVVEGHMQTTFANAKQIAKDTWEDYLQPRALFNADALTIGYFRPALVEELQGNIDPEVLERLFIWYDETDLVEHPNLAAVATEAFDRFGISWSAMRDALGFSEDDAPEPIEILVRLALGPKGVLTPNVVTAILDMMEGAPALPEPENPGGGPGADSGSGGSGTAKASPPAAQSRLSLVDVAKVLLMATAEDDALKALQDRGPQSGDVRPPLQLPTAERTLRRSSKPTRRERGLKVGQKLSGIDRELRTRLLVASNASMDRALEKAGNRLRSRAQHVRAAALRDVAPVDVARFLGRQMVADAGGEDDALAGAFDDLEAEFLTWAKTAGQQAVDVVYDLVGGFTSTDRERLRLDLADSADEAWTWMKETLTSLARARLYDPSPSAPPLGEFDASLRVPPGLVRQAIARAGGMAGLRTNGASDGPSAWVVLPDDAGDPPGGIGTGELMQSLWQDEGVMVDGYQWEYGPALRMRPFEPHEGLDGIGFANFDDEQLANGDSFPPYDYFMPGDHDGCMCDVTPILLPPE